MPSPGESLTVQAIDGGCRLRLRVKPKAARDGIVGTHGSALKLAVKEAPESGRANRAVCALLARLLGVAASSVTLVSGGGARDKSVRVEGLAADECLRRLRAHLA